MLNYILLSIDTDLKVSFQLFLRYSRISLFRRFEENASIQFLSLNLTLGNELTQILIKFVDVQSQNIAKVFVCARSSPNGLDDLL